MTSKKKRKRPQGRASRRQRQGINPLYVLIPVVAVLLVGVGWVLATITSSPNTEKAVAPVVSDSTVVPVVITPRLSTNATPVVGALTSSADMPRITVQELKAKLDADQAVVFDARTRAAYAKKHIAGATSMPQGEVASRLAELPNDKLVVFYCT